MTKPVKPSKLLQLKTVRKMIKDVTENNSSDFAAALSRLKSVDEGGPTGVNLLMTACRYHNVPAVQQLLLAGASPNATDATVPTASINGNPVLVYALDRGSYFKGSYQGAFQQWDSSKDSAYEKVLRLLLEAGADPTHPSVWKSDVNAVWNSSKGVLLMLESGRLPKVPHLFEKLLCEMPAEPEEKVGVLAWAAVMDRFIELGVDPIDRDAEGRNAWERYEMSSQFVEHSASPAALECKRSLWEERVMKLSMTANTSSSQRLRL